MARTTARSRMARIAHVALAGLGLSLAGPAHAMTCADITAMLKVNVPTAIVIQTMENSGKTFTAQDVDCLKRNSAPADVVAAAERTAAVTAPPAPAPAPAPGAAPQPAPSGGFGSDEMLGAHLPDEGEPPDEGGPPQIEQLVQLYRAKKYQTCSKEFYDLLASNAFPEHQTKIQYYLAKCLYDFELYHGAQHYFMEVVKRGPSNPYFRYALPRLVAIAEHTGNDTELLRIVDKIPPEAFPRRAQNHLYYLMGRKLFEESELSQAASYLRQISSKSELYMRSKYFEGIIASEQGKYRTAVQAFREVMQAEPPLAGDARKLQEIEDLKDLALINIARIYFGLERFDNADQYYAMVDRESTYWPESLFERAWASFWRQDLNQALGLLLTVQSPYFSEDEYIPEVTILRALTYFNLCEYDDVERILIRFEDESQAVIGELKTFVDQYRVGANQQILDQAYDAYFGRSHKGSRLQQALFSRVLRNRDLASIVRHLDMMDAELAAIDTKQGAFKATVGDELKRVIEADRQRYKVRAGRLLLIELARQQATLEDLMLQSEVIRFEVTDAQRQDYEFKMQNPDVGSLDDRKIDFSTSKTIIYWPFNGEFWADELGYYRYTEHGSCK